MPRLIDADALICKWKAAILHMVKEEDGMHPISMEVLIEDLGNAPTIEAEPVKHGRWEADKEDIYWGNHMVRIFCSCCKQTTYFDREKGKFILFDYCPNCGANMQGGNDHD